jgi:hypothetical protein
MNLCCGAVMLKSPWAPRRTQMMLTCSGEGPCVTLYDSEEKGRVVLSVDKDQPTVTICTAEGKDAVLLMGDPKAGLGLVAAMDNGKPRAFLKAAAGGAGFVSVVHDDGNSRVTMHGTEDSGGLMTINPDMKTTVSISSQGRMGGGLVVVNGPTGKPAAFLTHDVRGGVVMVNGPDGQPAASLPDAGFDKGKREE